VKYFITTILILIVILSSAQKDSLVPKVFYYGDGTISSEGHFLNNQPVGYWRTYYPNGHLKSEGNRLANALDGRWIFYNAKQDTVEIINYRNSLKNGWNIKYDSNKVISKQLYLNGKIVGLSYLYKSNSYIEIPHKNHLKHGLAFEYKDSVVIKLIEYKNGFKVSIKNINRFKKDTLKNGTWMTFYPNRKIHEEFFYKDDTLNGYYREYDVQGNLIKNEFFENGLVKEANSNVNASQFDQEYYANGNLKSEGYFTFGKAVGLHKKLSQDGKIAEGLLYDYNGRLIGKGFLDAKGKKTGKWIFYDENKKIKSEGYYKKGRRTKTWIFYYPNGKIEQKGNYKNGKLMGEWIQYYPDETQFKIEHYKKSNLDGEFIQNKPNGEIFVQGVYSDNQKDKEWVYHTQFLVIHQFYHEGERVGKWYSKYLNGKYQFKGEYENNLPNGKHVFYYQDGTIKDYQFYIYGSKERIWTSYDAFFDETFIYLYKNDKIEKINGYKYKFTD